MFEEMEFENDHCYVHVRQYIRGEWVHLISFKKFDIDEANDFKYSLMNCLIKSEGNFKKLENVRRSVCVNLSDGPIDIYID